MVEVILAIGMAIGSLMVETMDGKPFEINNYADNKATALIFMSSRCPVTQQTMKVIAEQHEELRENGIVYVGLVSNDAETADEVRAYSQGNGVRFPVYRDKGGEIAKRLGVTATPTVLLLDNAGKLVFRGGFSPDAAAKDFHAAVTAFFAGKALAKTESKIQGTAITEAGTPWTPVDNYGSIRYSAELIFERIPNAPVHHCSTITEAANGDLLCTWYGGSYESADDQVLFFSRLNKGERNWTAPEVLVRGDFMRPPGNAVIFRIGKGTRIGLFWGRMESSRPLGRGQGWGKCQLMYRFSDDHGKTWSADKQMDGLMGALPRNTALTLQDGACAVPLSGRVNGEPYAGFLLTTRDNGETWTRSGGISGAEQPTVIQRKDGSLLALIRSEPHVMKSESTDGGATWTKMESTGLRCPDSGIAMTRLNNGHLLLVHNNTPNSDRTPLNLLRSTDEGKTWSDNRVIEPNWGEYSYPCIIQAEDGTIHLTHTYRRYSMLHIAFNEDWITHQLRPN